MCASYIYCGRRYRVRYFGWSSNGDDEVRRRLFPRALVFSRATRTACCTKDVMPAWAGDGRRDLAGLEALRPRRTGLSL